jgi:hypothetical protein
LSMFMQVDIEALVPAAWLAEGHLVLPIEAI